MNALSQSLSLISELELSLFVHCVGLVGTYNDLALWISSNHHLFATKVTFLWLGNTMANMSNREAVSTMESLAEALPSAIRPLTTFILGLDACNDPKRILHAYMSPKTREWAMNALNHANELMGYSLLSTDDWEVHGDFNEAIKCFEIGFRARSNLTLRFDNSLLHLRAGDFLHLAHSSKWVQADLDRMLQNSKFRAYKSWSTHGESYSKLCLLLFIFSEKSNLNRLLRVMLLR